MKITFPQIPYQRCDFNQFKKESDEIFAQMRATKDVDEFMKLREDYLNLAGHFDSMYNVAYIRFSLNTRDEFYSAESDYYDEYLPLAGQITAEYGDILLTSSLRPQLEKLINPRVFAYCEAYKKANPPEIVADKQEENALITERTKLMSQIKVEFMGEQLPLPIVRGKLSDKDREVRKAAAVAIGNALQKEREKIGDIFDRMVKVRDRMAKKAGFKNYIPLGYLNMRRIDYDAKMVAAFRDNVKKDIVPLVCEIMEKIRKNLGIDKTTYYDKDCYLAKGNPRMVVSEKQSFVEAAAMYHEMSPILGEFFDEMVAADAFDVTSRDGKIGGGYCTAIPDYKQPFIFANFNGSADDVGTLTHEFGHAYAFKNALDAGCFKDLDVGNETAECHSMGMEAFCAKYMERFFGEAAKDFEFVKCVSDISFLPYGVMVDEFQHVVYEHPELTPEQRNGEWMKLEAKYRPYVDYDNLPALSQGCHWYMQGHIFESPFYYIDYCLSQIVALGFMAKSRENYSAAFEKYMRFVQSYGSKSFPDLVKEAEIVYPFKEGALAGLADDIRKIL